MSIEATAKERMRADKKSFLGVTMHASNLMRRIESLEHQVEAKDAEIARLRGLLACNDIRVGNKTWIEPHYRGNAWRVRTADKWKCPDGSTVSISCMGEEIYWLDFDAALAAAEGETKTNE